MKKRTTLLVLVLAVVALSAAGFTLAYFSDTDDATNTFTIGNVDIELSEPSWDGDVSDVYPGQVLPKDPIVTNIGANPCVVRIKVEWPTLPETQDETVPTVEYRTGAVEGVLGSEWKDGGDGYFYYMEPLLIAADSSYPHLGVATTKLFEDVIIPEELENGDGTTDYDIKVTAEAVQAQGVLPDLEDLLDGISDAELNAVKQMFNN